MKKSSLLNIFFCPCCIGKTTLSNTDNNFIDLDQSIFREKENSTLKIKNYFVYLANIAVYLAEQGYNVLLVMDPATMNELSSRNIKYYSIFLDPSLSHMIENRFDARKSSDFVNNRSLEYLKNKTEEVLYNFDNIYNDINHDTPDLAYKITDENYNLKEIIYKMKENQNAKN